MIVPIIFILTLRQQNAKRQDHKNQYFPHGCGYPRFQAPLLGVPWWVVAIKADIPLHVVRKLPADDRTLESSAGWDCETRLSETEGNSTVRPLQLLS